MAIQYSLNYDDQGNPSLVKNTVTGSRKVIDTSGFTIGEYKPTRTVSTDFTFTPTEDNREIFGTQTQYEILQTYINENNGSGDTTGLAEYTNSDTVLLPASTNSI